MGSGTRPGGRGITFASAQGRWVLLATILGSAVAGLDATAVNVALRSIGEDLDAGTAGLQWTLNGYLLTLAALILFGGSLGDRFGRRRIFTIGVIWFAAASLACGAAPDIGALAGARALQGIGGALLTPGSLAILQASFVPEDRARAIGAWSAMGGVATALGPLLGGYLVDAASWRWIFLLNLPLAALVVAVTTRHVPETSSPDESGPLDAAGAVSGAVGLAGITYALIEAPERGAFSPVVVAAGLVGVAALVAFVVAERRQRHPMLPLDIFASRQFTSANLVTFVVYAALGGVLFLLATYLQTSLDYSPVEGGLALFPVTLLMLALSERTGALAARIGPRVPMSLGPLIIAAGLLLMVRIRPGTSYQSTVLPAAVVFGLGLALTVAPLTATVLAAADARHSGIASGVNNAVARVAQLLAVAILPVAAGITGDDFADPEAFADGFPVAVLIAAGLALAGAAAAWLTISDEVLAAAEATPDPLAREPLRPDVLRPDPVRPAGFRAALPDRSFHCSVDGPPLSRRPLEPTRPAGGTGP